MPLRRAAAACACLALTAVGFGSVASPSAAASGSGSRPAAISSIKTINLINVNDFHGRIDTGTVKFAGTIEQLRAQYGDASSLLLSDGDNIGASLFASSSQQDLPTVEVLNALEVKTSSVGNHEFDRGFTFLTDTIVPAATFSYLGANVYLKGTTTPALPEYVVADVDGVKVGVIGAVTQETSTLVTPGGIAMLDFGDPVTAVNRVAAQLHDGNAANGEADVIVAEYHEGSTKNQADTTLEAELATPDAFSSIVMATSPLVDAIFNGHTHKTYAYSAPIGGATRPVVQQGCYGEFVGQVVLSYDPGTGEVVSHTERVVPRTSVADADLRSQYPRVEAVGTIVDTALREADVLGNQQVATVTADITTAFTDNGTKRDDRSAESALGNLVADALLSELAPVAAGGADFAVVNPGGVRAELYYGDDGGIVTYAEVNAVLPFANTLWTTTLTGAQVKTMLEEQWQRDSSGNIPSRPFLRLGTSRNLTYIYDASRPEGDRIVAVYLNNVPIDPAAEYRVGSFSTLIEGADNFRVFTEGTDTRDSGLLDRDVLIDFLGANSPVPPSFAKHGVPVAGVPAGSVPPGTPLSIVASGLDLTSLGSPTTTRVTASRGPVRLGSIPVVDGSVTIAPTVDAAWVGSAPLILEAEETGTVVRIPLTVAWQTFASTPRPRIAGTASTGSTLRVQLPAWQPAPVTLRYRWQRDGAPIGGATGAVYQLTAADVGTTVRVVVTGARQGYRPVSRASDGVVAARGTLSATTPRVTGTSRVGSTLTATSGAWSPAPVAVRYQWLRDGLPIPGATSTSYRLVRGDSCRSVSVRVSGFKPGYRPTARLSAAVAVRR